MDEHSFNVKTFNEILASVLLFSCVGALVYVVAFVIPSWQPDVTQHEYRYVLTVDSAGVLTDEARNLADSLISAVKHHERSINEHFDYVLQKKEETQNLYTAIGAILSVVIAVFGFFGYKNYKSIEEKAIVTANEKAEEKMRELEQKQSDVQKELREECLKKVKNDVTAQFRSFKEKEMTDVISRMIKDECITNVDLKLGQIDVLNQKIESIEISQQNVLARLDELEDKSNKPNGRSTAAVTQQRDPRDKSVETDMIDKINQHGKNLK